MAGFGWFWNALGDRSGRNQKQSKQVVQAALQVKEELRDAELGELAQRARAAAGHHEVRDAATLLAAVGEASARLLGLDPFPVQLQAALRLIEGDVIQMDTGEGKTLVGAMAATGLALTGQRVHAVTVNDYLAGRDAAWMRPLLECFGLRVGAINQTMSPAQRREAYACDVVYAPVTEIGFDVLRDRLSTSREAMVQASADVALVDEADSVLVDEALVPLVLAGSAPGTAPSEQITQAVASLDPTSDFRVDDAGRNAFLTDAGARKIERKLGIPSLYGDEHVGTTLVQVNLALHARALLTRDVHYLVRDGKVGLIDASKGRVAHLQRWPDGVQAAVEAKEGLKVTEGGMILDTITVQALMGRYPKVCGMTGTAVEATDQLRQFYGLRVSVIERHKPNQRFDEADRLYSTAQEKQAALVREIIELHGQQRPVLVGTPDVSESEQLAASLREQGITVSVLNAKNDAEEARIIAEAGDIGQVTVSTQMAGRGIDIRLGGADERNRQAVLERGGLAVLGSARHRTARLDNQLRGRAGRQGDPGSSLFFVSLEDDVVVAAGSEQSFTVRPEADGQIHDSRAAAYVDHCQRVTEGQLLEIHSQTWKYNKLLTDQRDILDERRTALLDTDQAWRELRDRAPERAAQLQHLGNSVCEQAARDIMLYHLDTGWAEHLAHLDEVRESIHLRAIARETPIDEFHRIAVAEFKELAQRAVDEAVATFRSVEIDSDGAHLEDEGLVRPSATWTYMVSDNPLASRSKSVLQGIGSIFR